MQGSNRLITWNFLNTVQGHEGNFKSGTVEFRGGRHLRGKIRTKRWIAFAVAFIMPTKLMLYAANRD